MLTFVAYQDFLRAGQHNRHRSELSPQHGQLGTEFCRFFSTHPAVNRTKPDLWLGECLSQCDRSRERRVQLALQCGGHLQLSHLGNAVLDRGTLYFISQCGDLHALDPADGTLRWRYATQLESRDGIVVGAGHLFVGSVDGAVSAFRLK